MALKFTGYFLYVRQRHDQAKIRIEWIEDAIGNPIYTETQADGRIRKWGKMEDGKCLRVILLEDGETVHNAFFDRGFKGRKK